MALFRVMLWAVCATSACGGALHADLGETVGEAPLEARAWVEAGDGLLAEDPVEAAILYKRALQAAEAGGDARLRADSHAKLGHACFLIGDHYAALSHHQSALDLYIELGAENQAAAQLSEIGSAYYFSKVGDLEKTKAYYEDAARWFQDNGMLPEAAMNLNYAAYTVWAQGDPAGALEMHQAALDTFERVGDRKGVATALSDIGFTLNSLARYEESLDYSRRALEIEKDLGDTLMQIPTLNNIAIAHNGLGQHEAALHHSKASYEMADRRNLLLRKGEALETLHQIYQNLGDFENAYRTLLLFKQVNDQLVISNQARSILEAEMAQEFRAKEQAMRHGLDKERTLAEETLRRERLRNTALLIILVLALLLVALLLRYTSQKRRGNRILKTQRTELREKNQALERSMHELRQAQSEMIRLEKNASLAVLTEGAAHEINNPMNFIQGAVYSIEDALDGREADREAIRTALGQIQEGIDRTATIINSLYIFNRQKENLELERLELHEYLAEWVASQDASLRARLRTVGAEPRAAIFADTDREVLASVLLRVAQNACEASGERDPVELRVGESPPDGVCIEVRDSGCGVSADNLSRVFDPFFTTKQSSQSVGLGLTFAQKWMSVLGGSVELRSASGTGTRVFIKLPREHSTPA